MLVSIKVSDDTKTLWPRESEYRVLVLALTLCCCMQLRQVISSFLILSFHIRKMKVLSQSLQFLPSSTFHYSSNEKSLTLELKFYFFYILVTVMYISLGRTTSSSQCNSFLWHQNLMQGWTHDLSGPIRVNSRNCLGVIRRKTSCPSMVVSSKDDESLELCGACVKITSPPECLVSWGNTFSIWLSQVKLGFLSGS